jgi:hypothetical protein
MLEKNLESKYRIGERQYAGRSWRKSLWLVMSSVTFVALFPFGLWAQAGSSPAQAGGFGTGAQTPLRFGGESAPNNQVSLSMGASTLYDDNVFSIGSQRVSDEAVSLSSQLNMMRQTEHVTINFGYTPFFMLYRQNSQFDRLNHAASLSMNFQLTPRFSLGLQDTFSYLDGIYPTLTGQEILSGSASPTALNQAIVPPTARTLSNTGGMNLTFTKTRRTSLTLSGGYTQQKFGSQAIAGQQLYSSRGFSGGLQYQYRVTEHTNFGLLLLHQDSTYTGGEVFGNRLRSQSESAFLSIGSHLSNSVSVTIFGGPQYVRTIGATVPGAGIAGKFLGAGGGSITKEVHKTALNLSVQRTVSSGGGLYAEVVQTSADFGVRRRLVGQWEAGVHGMGARVDTSLFQGTPGNTESLTGGIDFSRPLRGGSALRISYENMHQLSGGTLPISADFLRNEVTISFDFRLKAIPLGQ